MKSALSMGKVVAASVLFVSSGATADEAASPVLEQIIVTAQKREQSAQDVGITMSVMSGTDLARFGVGDPDDIEVMTPNVQVNSGLGHAAFTVRGVGIDEFAMNFDSPIAVHVDEVYLSKIFMTNFFMFDIERVEALKGPQGTLFGRNATGGAMNFYTKRPTNVFSMGAELSRSMDDFGIMRTEGYVSGPIGERSAYRLSVMDAQQEDGFYRNTFRGDTEGIDKRRAIRGQIQHDWDRVSVRLIGHYGEEDSISPPPDFWGMFTPESMAAGTPVLCPEYIDGTVNGRTANCVRGLDGSYPGDSDPYTSGGWFKQHNKQRAYGGTARVSYEGSAASITSITSFQHHRRDFDSDGQTATAPTLEAYYLNEIDQYSQELRLTSVDRGFWNYVVGAYYQHDKYDANDALAIGGGDVVLFTSVDQRLDTYSIFAHNEFSVSDNLSLIAGIRYSHDDLEIDGGTYAGTGLANERPAVILAPLALSSAIPDGGKRTDEKVTYKVGIEWKPDVLPEAMDDFLLYANHSTGYRAGAYNSVLVDTQEAFTSLKPETLDAYELGFKMMLADGRVQFNAAVFRYELEDGFINIDRSGTIVPQTVNASKVDTTGAEIDLSWSPAVGLQLGANWGWLDSEIKSDITSNGQPLKGNRPVNAPKSSGGGHVKYEIPLGSMWKLDMSVIGSYRSERYMEAANRPVNLQDSYWLMNSQVAVQSSDDRWRISLWGKNILDEEYRTYVNDVLGVGVLNLYGEPRTYGLSVAFKY